MWQITTVYAKKNITNSVNIYLIYFFFFDIANFRYHTDTDSKI